MHRINILREFLYGKKYDVIPLNMVFSQQDDNFHQKKM